VKDGRLVTSLETR